MKTKLWHFDSREEVELIDCVKDGPLYTGIRVARASGEIITLKRDHTGGWFNLQMGEYGCCRIVTDDELACYYAWWPVWLYMPAPMGYEFVSYRAHQLDGPSKYALRRIS